ncbi:MAG: DegT/DnrJ/EryC1/StrS family aminotransferase, partial [Acidobacteriota bacterium]
RHAATSYRERLGALGFTVAPVPEGWRENGYLSVVLFDPADRPTVETVLKEHQIGFGRVYPGAMSKQPGAGDTLIDRLGGEHADRLCQGVINPPLFAHMTDDEIDRVVDAFARVAERLR